MLQPSEPERELEREPERAQMVRPETAKWGQTLADLRRLSAEAEHVRTRERFLALYMIGSERVNATQWAAER
jgi:transposase